MDVRPPKNQQEVIQTLRIVRAELKKRSVSKLRCEIIVSNELLKVLQCQDRSPFRRKAPQDETERLLLCHPIYRVHFVCHDSQDWLVFGYLTRQNMQYSCHVFKATQKDMAMTIVHTISQAFHVSHVQATKAQEEKKLLQSSRSMDRAQTRPEQLSERVPRKRSESVRTGSFRRKESDLESLGFANLFDLDRKTSPSQTRMSRKSTLRRSAKRSLSRQITSSTIFSMANPSSRSDSGSDSDAILLPAVTVKKKSSQENKDRKVLNTEHRSSESSARSGSLFPRSRKDTDRTESGDSLLPAFKMATITAPRSSSDSSGTVPAPLPPLLPALHLARQTTPPRVVEMAHETTSVLPPLTIDVSHQSAFAPATPSFPFPLPPTTQPAAVIAANTLNNPMIPSGLLPNPTSFNPIKFSLPSPLAQACTCDAPTASTSAAPLMMPCMVCIVPHGSTPQQPSDVPGATGSLLQPPGMMQSFLSMQSDTARSGMSLAENIELNEKLEAILSVNRSISEEITNLTNRVKMLEMTSSFTGNSSSGGVPTEPTMDNQSSADSTHSAAFQQMTKRVGITAADLERLQQLYDNAISKDSVENPSVSRTTTIVRPIPRKPSTTVSGQTTESDEPTPEARLERLYSMGETTAKRLQHATVQSFDPFETISTEASEVDDYDSDGGATPVRSSAFNRLSVRRSSSLTDMHNVSETPPPPPSTSAFRSEILARARDFPSLVRDNEEQLLRQTAMADNEQNQDNDDMSAVLSRLRRRGSRSGRLLWKIARERLMSQQSAITEEDPDMLSTAGSRRASLDSETEFAFTRKPSARAKRDTDELPEDREIEQKPRRAEKRGKRGLPAENQAFSRGGSLRIHSGLLLSSGGPSSSAISRKQIAHPTPVRTPRKVSEYEPPTQTMPWKPVRKLSESARKASHLWNYVLDNLEQLRQSHGHSSPSHSVQSSSHQSHQGSPIEYGHLPREDCAFSKGGALRFHAGLQLVSSEPKQKHSGDMHSAQYNSFFEKHPTSEEGLLANAARGDDGGNRKLRFHDRIEQRRISRPEAPLRKITPKILTLSQGSSDEPSQS